MGNFTTRSDVFNALAQGKGIFNVFSTASTNGTGATAGSGFFGGSLMGNTVGTTYPTTLQSIQTTGAAKLRVIYDSYGVSSARGYYTCIAYQMGTLSLTSTGSQFTHDSATFPMTRTLFGQATKPLSLLPFVLLTTATSTTAPSFTMNYTNQDGNSVTGTKTFTFPAAATLIGSGYIMRLENNDSGVQDITSISVGTASSTGAATIYGLELFGYNNIQNVGVSAVDDLIFGGISFKDIRPAATTSGTSTNVTGILALTGVSATGGGWMVGVTDS